MKTIKLRQLVGGFAEDKDKAREIRVNKIMPSIEKNEKIVLDFTGVDSATQSFVHALISDAIRKKGADALDLLYFRNCNEKVKKIVNIVVDYMQDSV